MRTHPTLRGDECIVLQTSLDTPVTMLLPTPPPPLPHRQPNVELVSMTTGCHRQVEPSYGSCSLNLPFIDAHKRDSPGHSQDMGAGQSRPGRAGPGPGNGCLSHMINKYTRRRKKLVCRGLRLYCHFCLSSCRPFNPDGLDE